MLALWIALGVIVIGFLWVIITYNELVQIRENVKNGFSQINIQLQRRHDLIPNLVEIAKGYMGHEKDTLEKVIKARQVAVDASSLTEKVASENILTSTLRSLMVLTENYPNLKADAQMIRLQEELTSTENKISFSRQYYNDEAQRLNTAIQVFPDSFVASLCKFEKVVFFELVDAQAQKAPQIKF